MEHQHSGTPRFEYSKIIKYIYIGTNQCCKAHFNKELLAKGIKADISLEENRIDHPIGVKYYLWLPTPDHFAPTQEQLLCGAKFIKHLVDNKIPIYVHCKNGHGRAPTLVAAYLILENISHKQAIKLIKKKRNSIHLDKKQINALKKFEQFIKK